MTKEVIIKMKALVNGQLSTHPPQVQEDVVAEAMLRMCRTYSNGRGIKEASLLTMAYKITKGVIAEQINGRFSGKLKTVPMHHRVSDRTRSINKTKELTLEETIGDEKMNVEREYEIKEELERALVCLSKKERQILYMHTMQGYSYKEISELLDINSFYCLAKGLERVRKNFKKDLTDDTSECIL